MRRLIPLGIFALFAACGGDGGGTAPSSTGTARYVRDANTCNGAAAVSFDFFLDGALLGTQSLTAGQGAAFTVKAGGHVFSGRVTNTTLSFGSVNGTVPAGGVFNYTMICSS